MRFHTFLLKYGEIGIKGKNRYLFEDALVRQVRYALKDVDGNFDVHKSQARIYVDCEGDYDYEDTGGTFEKSVRTGRKLPGCPYGGSRLARK